MHYIIGTDCDGKVWYLNDSLHWSHRLEDAAHWRFSYAQKTAVSLNATARLQDPEDRILAEIKELDS